MLSLVLALALTQTGGEPVAAPAPAPTTAPRVSSEGRNAGLFSSPRVPVGRLLGRTGMGLVFGSLIGGAFAGGLMVIGATLTANGSSEPMALITPAAIVFLGLGTALGAAMFGDDYGRDLLDALIVAIACSVISVGTVVALFFLAPGSVGLIVALGVGLVFPALATPLLVQAFKPGDPQPTIAVATF